MWPPRWWLRIGLGSVWGVEYARVGYGCPSRAFSLVSGTTLLGGVDVAIQRQWWLLTVYAHVLGLGYLRGETKKSPPKGAGC